MTYAAFWLLFSAFSRREHLANTIIMAATTTKLSFFYAATAGCAFSSSCRLFRNHVFDKIKAEINREELIMELKEKILYYRKKAGLSQEALAEQLGVSRQAISKWETGDAVPEINKLLLLANAFGVTTDWLLCDEEPEEEKAADEAQPAIKTTWVDSLPGVIGRLMRRYGWLFGVYLAVAGACFTGIGALARYLVHRMFSRSPFGITGGGFPSDTIYFNQYGTQTNSISLNLAANNPVSIMGTVIMAVGIIMLVAGIILAVVLKKRSKE